MAASGISFENLIGIYNNRDKYVAVALRYLQDQEKAKDIFSESYASLLERREMLPDDPVKMSIYLMQTVKHKCLNEIKKDSVRNGKRRSITEEDINLLSDDNVTRHIIEKDIHKALKAAGLKMDKLTFDIYIYSRIEGLSHKELAEKFGITQNRVAKEIMKAGKVMEKVFKEYMHIFVMFMQLFPIYGSE